MVQAARQLAARLDEEAGSFTDASRGCEDAYRALLRIVAAREARCAFDRDGRPGAIAAVREALPPMERDLFDAIVDDHACEVAAIEEALYQLARVYGRPA